MMAMIFTGKEGEAVNPLDQFYRLMKVDIQALEPQSPAFGFIRDAVTTT